MLKTKIKNKGDFNDKKIFSLTSKKRNEIDFFKEINFNTVIEQTVAVTKNSRKLSWINIEKRL
jgi:hypothetical protein